MDPRTVRPAVLSLTLLPLTLVWTVALPSPAEARFPEPALRAAASHSPAPSETTLQEAVPQEAARQDAAPHDTAPHDPALREAGARRLVTPDDYGRFESLTFSALSPDGTWLAYGVRRVDEKEELRILDVRVDSTQTVPWGRAPAFSPDGRWLAWAVGSPPDAEEGEENGTPDRLGAALLDLRTGDQVEWEEIRAIAFDAEGRYVALHGHPPEEPEGQGARLLVRELETGRLMSFGNVGSFAWSEGGSLLALTIATGGEAGNGVQLYDAVTGRIRELDTSRSSYRHLSWRAEGADLAVLRSDEPRGADSTAHALLAWRGLEGEPPAPLVLESRPAGTADTLRVVGHRPPRWSDDGRHLSFGLRPDPEERALTSEEEGAGPVEGDPEPAEEEPAEEDGQEDGVENEEDAEEEVELPDLQLWHTDDVRIVPQQRAQREADRRSTLLAVWTPGEERVVQVGTHLRGNVTVTDDWRFGLERLTEPYPWESMFGRPYHDVWAVELSTGARTLAVERVRYSWESPRGRHLLTFDGADYRARDLHTGDEVNLTADLPAEFANVEYDTPTDLLPPFGIGGWMEEDEAVLLHDRYDVWRVSPDGTGGERLTRGAEEEVIHRVLPTGRDDGAHRAARPLYVSLREEPTERRGFARIPAGGGAPERLVFEDAWPRGLARADSADVYVFRSEARDVSPDLYVAGPDLSDARRVTNTNPFLGEFAWTRPELVHYESEADEPLKGVLLYPAEHDPSRTYPMIVYTYERLSQNKHQFEVPSRRSYYNFTVWTHEGYFVLLPDIVYRARDPGVSALEAVRPAVRAVVERGLVDPERVGLIGHSWGGYQATYLPTRTNLFAASVAGAPLTDFKSFMGQIHWNPGLPELSHWETGQARMEVPYWEDVEAHLRNSPLHYAHELDTPLLMAFGDQDGVVEWWQGTVFYNFARRAGKRMVLLVYEGEDHGFRKEPNQVDYHRRILEWFGHYLKDEPAPRWIEEGVPLDALDEEKRRLQGLDAAPRVSSPARCCGSPETGSRGRTSP